MSRSQVFFAATLFCALLLSGCENSQQPKWEIVADNQSDSACTVSLELAGGSYTEAKVDDLAAGKKRVVLSGVPKVIVRVVKIVHNGQSQAVKRNIEIPTGKRFLVLISADGKLNTSLTDQ